jgi:cytochrome oxidase Cu insertion factor (SCO1/SenC/PrrC family)
MPTNLKLRRPWLIALAAVLLVGLTLPNTAHAQVQDAVRAGVQIGAPLPHDLKVPDQSNQVQSFTTLKKNRGLILIFSRSLSW